MTDHLSPETISTHLDGRLASAAEAAARAHLEACAPCRRERDALRETAALLRESPLLDPPEHLYGDVLRRVRASGAPPAPSLWGRWVPLLATAGVMIGVGLSLWKDRLPSAPASIELKKQVIGHLNRNEPLISLQDSTKGLSIQKVPDKREYISRGRETSFSLSPLESPLPAANVRVGPTRPESTPHPPLRGTFSPKGRRTDSPVLEQAAPVLLDLQGYTSGVTTFTTIVLKDASAWETLWKKHTLPLGSPPPPPAVDFSRDMVVAVFLGEKPSGGWGVRIAGVDIRGGDATVSYKVSAPRVDRITTTALTRPYHIKTLPRRDGKVRFRKIRHFPTIF
jgi:hypothetical protein